MNIYKYLDYKKFINDFVETAKKIHKKYTFTQLSEAIGVQKTYLSKVMNGDSHLGSDQVFLLSKYFKLEREEAEFLHLLVEYARSGLHERRSELKKQIKSIQKTHSKTAKFLQAKQIELQPHEFAEYYLNPMSVLIHAYLTIPFYQKNVQKIADSLKIQKKLFDDSLRELENLGFIKLLSKNQAIITKAYFHLPPDNAICTAHQSLLRIKGLDQISRLTPEQKYVFSTTFTTSEENRHHIQLAFLDFVKNVEKVVRSGQPENCYQMNFDLFPWEVNAE